MRLPRQSEGFARCAGAISTKQGMGVATSWIKRNSGQGISPQQQICFDIDCDEVCRRDPPPPPTCGRAGAPCGIGRPCCPGLLCDPGVGRCTFRPL